MKWYLGVLFHISLITGENYWFPKVLWLFGFLLSELFFLILCPIKSIGFSYFLLIIFWSGFLYKFWILLPWYRLQTLYSAIAILLLFSLCFQLYFWWLKLKSYCRYVFPQLVIFPVYEQKHLTWEDLKPEAKFSSFFIYKVEQT